MSGEESESRSDRLRRRRSNRDRPDESDEPAETDKPSKPSKLAEPSDESEPSVKEEQVGTYMYLPESQKKEVERLYNVLKADYETNTMRSSRRIVISTRC